MLQVGFDASPLVRPHPRGIQRVVAETLDALEARGEIEVLRQALIEGLASGDRGALDFGNFRS